MRFTVASVAFFAGLAVAAPAPEEIVYETKEVTITSCAPEVTDCPGNSAQPTEAPEQPVYSVPGEPSYPAEPTYPAEPSADPTYTDEPSTPAEPTYPAQPTYPAEPSYPAESSSYVPSESPVPTSSWAVPPPVYSDLPSVPAPYPTPAEPIISVITISTCIPTVTYSTITITPTSSPSPTGGVPSYSYPAQGTSVPPAPQFTGAASNVGGSVAFAGVVAAMAAFFA